MENPTLSTENSPISTENPIVSMENPPISTENTVVFTENSPISTENPIVSTENSPISTENPTVSTENPPISTENPVIFTENSPISTENPTVSTENSGICSRKGCQKYFSLGYDKPVDFVQSQFECGRKLYIVWRAFWAIYHLTGIIACATAKSRKWFIYLTNWSYFCLTLDALLEFIAVVFVRRTRPDILSGDCTVTPWYLKVVWFVYNLSSCSAVLVTSLYWSLLHKLGSVNWKERCLSGEVSSDTVSHEQGLI